MLSTFYRLPVSVFEPHAGNVLKCPPELLRRIVDDSALSLRRYRDEILRDRVLRHHLGEELNVLEGRVLAECERLYDRVAVAEQLLERDADTFPSSAGVDEERRNSICVADHSGDDCGGVTASVHDNSGGRIVDEEDGRRGRRRRRSRNEAHQRRFAIAACDPEIYFSSDFRGEVMDTVFGTSQAWSYACGPWYYKLKRWLFPQQQWRRVYRLTQIDSLCISQELLSGVLSAVESATVYPTYDCLMSDLEAAACILAAYHASLDDQTMPQYGDVGEVLSHLPRLMKLMAEDVNIELSERVQSGASASNLYAFRDPSDMRFFIPTYSGRHYGNSTFADHLLVAVLIRRRVLVRLPGHGRAVGDTAVDERVTGRAVDDLLFVWTRRLLHRRLGNGVPVIVHEQQYLRLGLTAIASMFLVWRTVNAESVFGTRRGKFSLTDVIGEGSATRCEESGFVGDRVHNFDYLVSGYVCRWYALDKAVTVSQLFPGLVIVCVIESTKSGWDPRHRASWERDAAQSSSDVVAVQPTRVDPIVSYMFTQCSTTQMDSRRLEAHDILLFHYENGLGRMLSVSLPRHRMSALAGSLFNVMDAYEMIYFLVLGFLPTAVVS